MKAQRVLVKDVNGYVSVKMACDASNGKVFITSEQGWESIRKGDSDLMLIGFDEADVFEFDPKYAERPDWGNMKQWRPQSA